MKVANGRGLFEDVLIAAATFAVLLATRRIPEPVLILGAGVAGVALH